MPLRKHMQSYSQTNSETPELDLLGTGARVGECISLPHSRGEGVNI